MRAARSSRSPTRRRARRTGAVLLEAMIAITMIVIAGVGMVTLLGQSVTTAREAHRRDRDVRLASATLERVMLWTRAELDARVGTSRLGCCVLTIDLITPALYRVALLDTATNAVVLETTVYQPPPTHAPTP